MILTFMIVKEILFSRQKGIFNEIRSKRFANGFVKMTKLIIII